MYRTYSDSALCNLEVPFASSIRSIASSMGIPYYHRFRLIDVYHDSYVTRRDYKVDHSGFLFSIKDVVEGSDHAI